MMLATLLFGAATASPGALLLFLVTTAGGLLLGHSVGFHRLLIHRGFETPLWMERTLVWIGTLVGMGGPLWMIRTHDMRDWAQRQSDCHSYLAHRRPMLVDAWWQIHCRLQLAHPPGLRSWPCWARSGLSLPRTDMDRAAVAHRAAVPRSRRLGLGDLGHLRAGHDLDHGPLVHRAPCAHPRAAKLAGRGRRRAGA